MSELISPTVDLFLYDLRHEPGQTPEEIQENRTLFLQKLPIASGALAWEKDNRSEAEFIELFDERKQVETLPLAIGEFQGYCYPVRIQQAYGLLLNCSVKNKSARYSIPYLAKIARILEESLQGESGTLGQTWMISACIEPFTYTQATSVAKECYRNFIPGASWEENLTSTSNFLGGKLFELWDSDNPPLEVLAESIEGNPHAHLSKQSHHVIVAIYPNLETAAAATYFVGEWLRLFCYRHQVIWHYHQSRILKELLIADRVDIQNYFETLGKDKVGSTSLGQIEGQLDTIRAMFADYSLDLNELYHKIAAMDLSLECYHQHIDGLATSLAAENLAGDLSFLGQFANLARDRYLRFLQKDLDTARGGLELLELAIQLLRAEISVSQAKSERAAILQNRAFQNTASILGTALGASLLTATITARAPVVEQKQIQATLATPVGQSLSQTLAIPPVWIVPSVAAALSVAVGAIAAGVTAAILAFWHWGTERE